MSLLLTYLRKLGGRRPVRPGDRAPDFTLRDSDGNEQVLSHGLAQGSVLLAFYPRAFTFGCTRELRRYAQRHQELAAARTTLWAISVDDPTTLARFKTLLGAAFPFLSDPDGRVSRLYSGLTRGLANRTTVHVAPGGKVTRVTAGVAALFPGHEIVACTQVSDEDPAHPTPDD